MSLVSTNDFADKRESETCPTDIAGIGIINAKKLGKESRDCLWRNAHSVISDPHNDLMRFSACSDFDRFSLWGKFNGVRYQIHQDLAQAVCITTHWWQRRRNNKSKSMRFFYVCEEFYTLAEEWFQCQLGKDVGLMTTF